MILKTIIRLLGIVAIGLMMGSSINYAVKGYGLLGASGSWARLIAQSIASSSSSSSKKAECLPGVDITKYTCQAQEAWKVIVIGIDTNASGEGSATWNRFVISITGQAANQKINVPISVAECSFSEKNVCAKTHVTNNPPRIISGQ